MNPFSAVALKEKHTLWFPSLNFSHPFTILAVCDLVLDFVIATLNSNIKNANNKKET